MYPYIPRPWHLFIPALICFCGSAASAWYPWLGAALMLIGVLGALWIMAAGAWEAKASYNSSLARVAEAIKDLNPDQWQAIGIRFPELRVRYQGQPVRYLEDTEIRMEAFERFMADSSTDAVAPQRYYGDGTALRRQWHAWIGWLTRQGYIIPNSASGNHSLLWRPGRHQQLMQMYLSEPTIKITELSE